MVRVNHSRKHLAEEVDQESADVGTVAVLCKSVFAAKLVRDYAIFYTLITA